MIPICLILFIPNKKINFKDFVPDRLVLKDILNISLSTTGSRLIGSISYFLEPIILTYVLIHSGYSSSYIIKEYGVITGYVYPLLLLPSFFTMAISTSLLPIISSSYAKGLYKYAKKKLKQAIYISLGIGVFCTCLFMTIPDVLLNFIYNTNLGINYIKIIAPFFILHYIQGPLTSYLQAIDKSNIAMYGTLVGMAGQEISFRASLSCLNILSRQQGRILNITMHPHVQYSLMWSIPIKANVFLALIYIIIHQRCVTR